MNGNLDSPISTRASSSGPLRTPGFSIQEVHIPQNLGDIMHSRGFAVNHICQLYSSFCPGAVSIRAPYLEPHPTDKTPPHNSSTPDSKAPERKVRPDDEMRSAAEHSPQYSSPSILKTREEKLLSSHAMLPAIALSFPVPQPLALQEGRNRLRPDEDILRDVRRSFAEDSTGVINWSDDILKMVLKAELQHRFEAAQGNVVPNSSPISYKYIAFYSAWKMDIDLGTYIGCLIRFTGCSATAFAVMLVYLDRIQERCKDLVLSEQNCHRVISTTLMLAIKYLEDRVPPNTFFAKACAVSCPEMNRLEENMLDILGWNLTVSPETFGLYEECMTQSARMLPHFISLGR